MDYNLETWKGSCGYSIPGRKGLTGGGANSIHFSSIDTSTSDTSTIIKERILNNQSLTDNTEAITEEIYKKHDYILDTYGQLSGIDNITENDVTITRIGNIAFQEKKKYKAPVNINGKAEIKFILSRELDYPPYSNYGAERKQNAYIQRGYTDTSLGGNNTKLWRYRFYGNIDYSTSHDDSSINIPKGYYIMPSENSDSSLICTDDDGTEFFSDDALSVVKSLTSSEEYCKICAVLNNGLVIESIPSPDNKWGIFIEKGYIESIDTKLTTLVQYTKFAEEIDAEGNGSSIQSTLITGESTAMFNMYLEYSHNGELYRMNVNVT